MNKLIIYEYMKRITKGDILKYSNSLGVSINNNELDIIYNYITKDYKRILNQPEIILNEAKNLLTQNTYHVLETLYYQYKDKIPY